MLCIRIERKPGFMVEFVFTAHFPSNNIFIPQYICLKIVISFDQIIAACLFWGTKLKELSEIACTPGYQVFESLRGKYSHLFHNFF